VRRAKLYYLATVRQAREIEERSEAIMTPRSFFSACGAAWTAAQALHLIVLLAIFALVVGCCAPGCHASGRALLIAPQGAGRAALGRPAGARGRRGTREGHAQTLLWD